MTRVRQVLQLATHSSMCRLHEINWTMLVFSVVYSTLKLKIIKMQSSNRYRIKLVVICVQCVLNSCYTINLYMSLDICTKYKIETQTFTCVLTF